MKKALTLSVLLLTAISLSACSDSVEEPLFKEEVSVSVVKPVGTQVQAQKKNVESDEVVTVPSLAEELINKFNDSCSFVCTDNVVTEHTEDGKTEIEYVFKYAVEVETKQKATIYIDDIECLKYVNNTDYDIKGYINNQLKQTSLMGYRKPSATKFILYHGTIATNHDIDCDANSLKLFIMKNYTRGNSIFEYDSKDGSCIRGTNHLLDCLCFDISERYPLNLKSIARARFTDDKQTENKQIVTNGRTVYHIEKDGNKWGIEYSSIDQHRKLELVFD